jgi:hypothetical protein
MTVVKEMSDCNHIVKYDCHIMIFININKIEVDKFRRIKNNRDPLNAGLES